MIYGRYVRYITRKNSTFYHNLRTVHSWRWTYSRFW